MAMQQYYISYLSIIQAVGFHSSFSSNTCLSVILFWNREVRSFPELQSSSFTCNCWLACHYLKTLHVHTIVGENRQSLDFSLSVEWVSLCMWYVCVAYCLDVTCVAGRDGLTHNMLSDIHNHWKHAEAVRIKCMGVPTVDMKNVCTQLEVLKVIIFSGIRKYTQFVYLLNWNTN